jgi:hypothetical protein
MRQVTVTLPTWVGKKETQEEIVRDLRPRALLKMEFYRSRMKLLKRSSARSSPVSGGA